MSAAVVIVAAIALAAFFAGRYRRREGFVSQKAVETHRVAQELFEGGASGYGAFKARAAWADPVLHSDVWDLWRAGTLTPADVQRVL